jgi:hypothetical protein
MMAPQQGMKPTAAQQDTEAIIAARIQAGTLDPNNPKAMAQARQDILGRGGRIEATGQPFQALSPMVDKEGEFIGYGVFDQRTSKWGIAGKDGTIQPVPDGARPNTATGINKFVQLRDTLTGDEIALKRMTEYLKNVKNSAQGIGFLADKFTSSLKTFFDAGALNPQELARAISSGQAQALIGQNRLEVLGGGVLTEQDALRVLAYLGGDENAFRNKEVVQNAIQRIFEDKSLRYKKHIEDYNAQVKEYYGSRGYAEAKPAEFDLSVFTAPMKSSMPTPALGVDAKRARLMELEAKAKSKK